METELAPRAVADGCTSGALAAVQVDRLRLPTQQLRSTSQEAVPRRVVPLAKVLSLSIDCRADSCVPLPGINLIPRVDHLLLVLSGAMVYLPAVRRMLRPAFEAVL